MLDAAIAWLQQADPIAIYCFLFCISFLENIVPPIPGDVPVAFIGYLMYNSQITFTLALLWASLGSLFGFMVVFLLSRHFGQQLYSEGVTGWQHRVSKSIHSFFPPSDMELLRQKFATHGYLAVLVNRFLFGSRAVISVMAGLMHLKIVPVVIAALLSAVAWNSVLLLGGFLLGSHWQHIGQYAALYSIPVSLLFLLFIGFSVWHFLKERKQKQA